MIARSRDRRTVEGKQKPEKIFRLPRKQRRNAWKRAHRNNEQNMKTETIKQQQQQQQTTINNQRRKQFKGNEKKKYKQKETLENRKVKIQSTDKEIQEQQQQNKQWMKRK